MWEVTGKLLDRVKEIVKVKAVRTDDITGEVFTYVCVGLVDTPDQRTAVLDSIKNAYLDYLDKQVETDIILAGLEDTATNALNTWEATL